MAKLARAWFTVFLTMKKSKNKGQSIVEFVFALPLLILIGIGLFDIGRAFFTIIVVTNASREGARYLVQNPDDKALGFLDTKSAARNEALASGIDINSSDVTVTCPGDATTCNRGSPVTVTVGQNFNLVFGIFDTGTLGFFNPGTLRLERTTQMRVP